MKGSRQAGLGVEGIWGGGTAGPRPEGQESRRQSPAGPAAASEPLQALTPEGGAPSEATLPSEILPENLLKLLGTGSKLHR